MSTGTTVVPVSQPGKVYEFGNPLRTLELCGGFYECPKDASGKRLGPLVGYAGRDEHERQYVGDVYANFAKIEQHSEALRGTANELMIKLIHLMGESNVHLSTGFCGAPMGGLALASILAQHHVYQSDSFFKYIFPEKKIIEVATKTSREKSELIFDRHEPTEGSTWWLVEDVCNNFSTTKKMVELVQSFGAHVLGIVCFLNRSMTVRDMFTVNEDLELPVIALVDKPFDQFKQNDPFVAEDVAAGNVCWKPKKRDEWSKLMAATRAARY